MSDPSSTTLAETTPSKETSPDWEMISFEVTCARCGQDLRGLSDPVCPKCGLEFDWAEAVPIEELTCAQCGYHLYGLTGHRCPECGTTFTWEDTLADYHRRRNPLFEYQWRRRPIRSLFRTWRRTLRPKRFWRSVDIHDPPRAGPLIFGVILGCFLLAVLLVLMQGVDNWIRQSQQWVINASGKVTVRYRLNPVQLQLSLLQALRTPSTYDILKPVVGWVGASLIALMVFPQSMRMCKVRVAQVLRVWAYALPPLLPLSILFVYLVNVSFIAMSPGYVRMPNLAGPISLCVVGFTIWSLHCGYRDYLKMPHSVAIAIASQVIAVLLGGLFEFLFNPHLPGTVFFQLLNLFGLI